MNDRQTLEELIVAIEDIDISLAHDKKYREEIARQLEDVADVMLVYDMPTTEIDAAINWMFKDPEHARAYIYGPTDIGLGLGVLANLRKMLTELED
jgi:hypothetical protein